MSYSHLITGHLKQIEINRKIFQVIHTLLVLSTWFQQISSHTPQAQAFEIGELAIYTSGQDFPTARASDHMPRLPRGKDGDIPNMTHPFNLSLCKLCITNRFANFHYVEIYLLGCLTFSLKNRKIMLRKKTLKSENR